MADSVPTSKPKTSPKPLRLASRLARLLLALEVPEHCGCHFDVLQFAERDELVTDERPADPGIPEYRLLAVIFGTDACRHTLDTDHELTLEQWVALLKRHDPDGEGDGKSDEEMELGGYADRPLPTKGEAITKPDRLKLYEARADAGLGLFNPEDILASRSPKKGSLLGKGRKEIGIIVSEERKENAT